MRIAIPNNVSLTAVDRVIEQLRTNVKFGAEAVQLDHKEHQVVVSEVLAPGKRGWVEQALRESFETLSFPGHKGVPGQRGGSSPKGGGTPEHILRHREEIKTPMKSGGTFKNMQSTGVHNVTAIDHEGSPKSTQVWDGGPKEAAKTVLRWQADSMNPNQSWDHPVRHAYIHQTGTGEVHHYDMSKPSHVAALKKMAFGD